MKLDFVLITLMQAASSSHISVEARDHLRDLSPCVIIRYKFSVPGWCHTSLSSHLTPQSCLWLAVKVTYKPLIGWDITRHLTRGRRLNKKNFCHQNIFFIGAIQYNLHSELTLQLFFTTATTPSYWSLIGHCDENTRVASDWSVLTQSRHISRLSCILMGANDLVNRLRERGGQCLSHDPHVEHGHYLRYLFPVCTESREKEPRKMWY